jgi:hypothetical protein
MNPPSGRSNPRGFSFTTCPVTSCSESGTAATPLVVVVSVALVCAEVEPAVAFVPVLDPAFPHDVSRTLHTSAATRSRTPFMDSPAFHLQLHVGVEASASRPVLVPYASAPDVPRCVT